jgi:hypothetical protein
MAAIRLASACALVLTQLVGCGPSAPAGPAVPPGPSVTLELVSGSATRDGAEIVCTVKYRITAGRPEPTDRFRVEFRDPKEGFAIIAKLEGKDLTPEGEFKGRFVPRKPFGPEPHPYQIMVHQDYPGEKGGLASNVLKGEV